MRSKIWTIIGIIVLIYLISYTVGNVFDLDTSDKIAVIPIIGTIMPADMGFSFQQKGAVSSDIIEFIKAAEEDDDIKGIILEINSPGGTVVASKEVATAVKAAKKPTTALIKDIGTSGAYWVASAADTIVADQLSLTGSIGVTASYLEFSKLFDEYGITYESLTTGKYKDIGSPFKELTADDESVLQKKLEKIHNAFVKEIANNRDLPEETVQQLATGIFYLGEEAYELGLIDHLGNKELAITLTEEAAGIEDAKIITYKKQRTIIDVLSSMSASSFYFMGRGMGESQLKAPSSFPYL